MKDDDFFDPDLPPVTPLTTTGTTDTPAKADAPHQDAATEEAPAPAQPDAVRKSPEFLGWSWKAWCGFAVLAAGIATGLLWPEGATAPPANAVLEDVPAPGPADSTTPAAAAPDDAVRVMTAQQAYSRKNREAIIQYSRRIATLEQKLTTLETRLAEQSARLSAQPAPAATTGKTRPAKPVKTAHRASRHASTTGWHINTLYPGMAWIARGDSTWAVHPGDTVQGLHITGIDVAHRQVLTDHGTIH